MTEQNHDDFRRDDLGHDDETSALTDEVPSSTDGLRIALRLGAIGLALLTVISLTVWWMVDGMPGFWGALIGAAIGGFFVLTTAIVTVATAGTNPQTTAVVLLGTWLLKILVAIVVVASIQDLDFYSDRSFALTIVLALVVVLGCETWGVLKTRTPYVEAGDQPG